MSQAHTERTKTDRLRDRAHDTADAARDAAREKTQGAQEAARQRAERFRAAAEGKASELRSEAEATADAQKAQVAGRASNIASAFRTAASELREQDEPLGVYVEQASDQIDRFSSYLNERSPSDLLADAELQARRNPWLFVGGAFAIGLAAGRFLKAGASHRASPTTALQPIAEGPPALSASIARGRASSSEEDVHGHHS